MFRFFGYNLILLFLQVQTEYSTSLASSTQLPDSMYGRTSISSPGSSARPPPPLPPTPPPYSATPSKTSTSQSSVYNQTSGAPSSEAHARFGSHSGAMLTPYPQPLMPPLLFNRPGSIPLGIYGSSPTPHQGENPSNISQNMPISLSSIHSIGQLQPLQPPQIPRPPQPPPHLRPPIPASPQSEHSMALLQNSVQVQQSLQMLQPPQASPGHHVYYQNVQTENFQHALQQQQRVEHSQPQALQGQGAHGVPQQQQDDAGMSLQHYFSSPEAIQVFLFIYKLSKIIIEMNLYLFF